MSPALCGAKTRQGHPCRNAAGYKTDHVGWGRCAFHSGSTPNGQMAAASEAAGVEAGRFGLAIETDPHEALSAIVAIVAGQVAFLRRKVDELQDGDVITGDALHPTIRAFNSVLEQWRSVSKTAIDAGVEERRLQLDELAVERVIGSLRRAFAKVPLSADQLAQLQVAVTQELAAELDDLAPRELVA